MGVTAIAGESEGDGAGVLSAVVTVGVGVDGSGVVGEGVETGVGRSGVVGSGVRGAIVGSGTVVRGAVVVRGSVVTPPVGASVVGVPVAVVGWGVTRVVPVDGVGVGEAVAGGTVVAGGGASVVGLTVGCAAVVPAVGLVVVGRELEGEGTGVGSSVPSIVAVGITDGIPAIGTLPVVQAGTDVVPGSVGSGSGSAVAVVVGAVVGVVVDTAVVALVCGVAPVGLGARVAFPVGSVVVIGEVATAVRF